MTIRISMWSGPRNISTTMMRAFESRPDTCVFDEPYYGAYLRRTGADHPYREETIAAWPPDEAAASSLMSAEADAAILFFKHIAYHIDDADRLDWLGDHRHFILIRDPRAMVRSFAARFDDVAPIVDSFAKARRIRDRVMAGGAPCPVIDAADILADPPRALAVLCAALAIPYREEMLRWPDGPRASDGPWAPHWYAAVRASTGFGPPSAPPSSLPDALEAVAGGAMTDYTALAAARLVL